MLRACREYGLTPAQWRALERGDRVLMLADMAERDDAQQRAHERANRGRR
jgi:hypothetical protein